MVRPYARTAGPVGMDRHILYRASELAQVSRPVVGQQRHDHLGVKGHLAVNSESLPCLFEESVCKGQNTRPPCSERWHGYLQQSQSPPKVGQEQAICHELLERPGRREQGPTLHVQLALGADGQELLLAEDVQERALDRLRPMLHLVKEEHSPRSPLARVPPTVVGSV